MIHSPATPTHHQKMLSQLRPAWYASLATHANEPTISTMRKPKIRLSYARPNEGVIVSRADAAIWEVDDRYVARTAAIARA